MMGRTSPGTATPSSELRRTETGVNPIAWAHILSEVEEVSRRYSKKIPRTHENCPFKLPQFPKSVEEALVRTLAQELGPRGIRVNVVSAGVVDTDALKYFPNREQLLAEFGRRAPAGPTLSAEAVADAVYLLCLPESDMITGHTLVVDGGYCISG